MARHVNIPIFIPHEGCRNECVFCNQRTITGIQKHCDENVKTQIDEALSTIENDAEIEIAFFGGSFTGIGVERITYLCSVAYEYVKQGRVKSIRLSTRPDYIYDEILTILKNHGVTHIELGIQSMNQTVLDVCKRGHTTEDTEKASRLINDYGFILGGQMMVGLPSSSVDDEIFTAQEIIRLGCKEARIYPCVVFCGTELCEMAKRGDYSPISHEDAVERCHDVYRELKQGNINILRIGLQSSEALSDKSEVYAGANHPSMGELVKSRWFYGIMSEKIGSFKSDNKEHLQGKLLHIECAPCNLSQVIGQNKKNRLLLSKQAQEVGFSGVKITQNSNISKDNLNIYFE